MCTHLDCILIGAYNYKDNDDDDTGARDVCRCKKRKICFMVYAMLRRRIYASAHMIPPEILQVSTYRCLEMKENLHTSEKCLPTILFA